MAVSLSDLPDHIRKQVEAKTKPATRSTSTKYEILARGARPDGKMNKHEEYFEREYLIPKRSAGEVIEWHYEKFRWKIGENCFYKPDFFAVMADLSINIYEVKGYWTEKARVKTRAAADAMPWFRWIACYRKAGVWQFEMMNHKQYKP